MRWARLTRVVCATLLAVAACVGQAAPVLYCSCTSCTCVPRPPKPPKPPKTPKTPKPPTSPDVPELYRATLEEHNRLRAKHQAPPLKWDERLAEGAERWARRCVFEHDPNSEAGENLYSSWGEPDPDKVLRSAVKAWYGEVRDYRYGSRRSAGTGHFTQVVWKGSTRLGCSAHRCKPLRIVVCRYSPPGNVAGQYDANVLPPPE